MTELQLAPGGLLGRIERRAHVDRLRSQIIMTLVTGWVPFCALGLLDRQLTGRRDPMFFELSVHVRLLVIPIFLIAEYVLQAQCRRVLGLLMEEGLVPDDRRQRLEEVIKKANRLGNGLLPDLVLMGLALLSGFATLVGWLRPTALVGTVQTAEMTAGRLWFGAVAMPLFQFTFWHAVWLWGLWVWVLYQISRLGLAYQPGHPDRRGGVEFLSYPSVFFQSVFLFATSCIIASSWGTQLLHGHARLGQFKNLLVAHVVCGLSLAFGPLLLFTPRLFLIDREGRREFATLATEYLRRFRERWVKTPHDDPLGTPDIQSLNDLSSVYRDSVERTRLFLFGVRDLIPVTIAMLLPMFPLVLTEIPVEELVRRLGGLLVGAR